MYLQHQSARRNMYIRVQPNLKDRTERFEKGTLMSRVSTGAGWMLSTDSAVAWEYPRLDFTHVAYERRVGPVLPDHYFVWLLMSGGPGS